ncbi:MAG: hypothetical protein UT50_C0017G0016 [Candidatus Moranbacteria bacterium GW2011_GWA2_39_41]|nr:MAG: hypothetical protein UT50_C0017G0016 [Candidatus Moranbacteria bacterium GW2011_GWA2_39_41]
MKLKVKFLALFFSGLIFFILGFYNSQAAVDLIPSHTSKPATTVSGIPSSFANPLGNVNTVKGVLSNVLNNLKGIIASIAIVFIVVGGFMYILSAGDEKMITKAKATIGSALIGLAIALAAPTFLKEIATILSTGDGASADAAVAAAPTIKEIATRVLNLLLSIVGIIAMIGLVIGGSFYLTAYGDEKKVETGKGIITNSIIGIAVAMIALVLVRQVASLLGVQ